MCQSYLLLFVYQSQSQSMASYRQHFRPRVLLCPRWTLRVWMHAVVVLFVLERSTHSQLSRELIVHRAPADANAPLPPGTLRGVCLCLRSLRFLSRCCWGTARFGSRGSRLNLRSLSPLSESFVLQLSSSEEVDVVSIIVDEIEYSPSQSFAYVKHTAF